MYGDELYQRPPRSPVPAAVLASIITTIVVFFGLRVLEDRGLLPALGRRGASAAVEVPSLLGMRPEQAREILKGRELLLSITSDREDAQHPAGAIAAQTPLPGSQAPHGTAVQVVLSRGTKKVRVPNLVGLPVDEAVRQLTAAGLGGTRRKDVESSTAAAGTVIQTEPAMGMPVAPDASVTLVVSSGPAGKPVPSVVRLRLSRARKLLEEQGFKAGKVRYESDDDRMGGVVLEQQPPAGTNAVPGTAVDLVVNED